MFAVSALCLAAVCSLLCKTDAAITAWTAPVIATKDGSATVTVAEDKAVGVAIVTLGVTGATTPTFSIVSQPASAKLAITTADLALATGKNFDFETETSYVVVVKCVDTTDNTASGTATATITITITNVNESPVFASSQYVVTIPDASGAGTTLTTVKATDPDAGNTVTYGISAGNTGSVFTIGASTGIITVAASKTTNAATVGGFQLTVTATDGTTTPASSTVWVAVKTCSSNAAALIASGVTMLLAFAVSLQ